MSNVVVLIMKMDNQITLCLALDESQASDARLALWGIHDGARVELYNCIVGKMPDNVRERVLEIQKRRSSVSVNKDAEIKEKDAEIQALKDKIDLIQAGCFFYGKTPQYWLRLQAAAQENGLDNLVKENEKLKIERDLAIAHDTQPYPTADTVISLKRGGRVNPNQCTSTTQREDFYHDTITLQCEQSSGHQGLHHAAMGAWNSFWKDNNGKEQDQTKNSLLNN
jgi:hypothetical protein